MTEVVQEKANAVTVCMQEGLLGRLKCQNVTAHPAFICVFLKNQRQEKRKDNIVCGSMNNGPLHLVKTEIMDLSQA